MLAALEASDDEEDTERRQERLRIQDVVRQTDSIVLSKEQEIEELKQLLESQSSSLGSMAVGAAAFAEILSQDEVLQTERDRLRQLQIEWEEKLRQAEIDLSVQRAKIARERVEIEERHRLLQVEQAQQVDDGPPPADGKPRKPGRGRWLTRLGLKEDDAPSG
jgi:hypothetical protein